MKKCKWCREEIREEAGTITSWPWIHAVGTYSCPRHPETVAEPADERWENVKASVSKAWKITDDPENPILTMVFFDIEVDFEGVRYWCRQQIHPIDLEMARFNLYGWILDKMVVKMDDEHIGRGVH